MSKFLSLVLPCQAEVLPVVTNSKALTFADFNALVQDLDQGFFKAGASASSVHAGFIAIPNTCNFAMLNNAIQNFLEQNGTVKVWKSIIGHEPKFVWFALYVSSSNADASELAAALLVSLRLLESGAYVQNANQGESLDDDDDTAVIAND
jgi:hypothetical protein